MERVLEPEVMDSMEDAIAYDEMDFTEVNKAFAELAIALAPQSGTILDVGTGTARIPILISQHSPQYKIIGIDLAKSMLEVGLKNVQKASLSNYISLELVDAKNMPYQDKYFDMVISNSIIHHLPDPLPFLKEAQRILQPNGAILLRDLLRPANEEIMNNLVDSIGSDYNDYQKTLFRDSLHAAFTLDEIKALIEKAGLENITVYQSSDRHWTAKRSFK